ncbi:MAG: histidine kinase [Bryobacterales bacterium]|nr:histidine kinase [Bryobacterales bacterium]
MPDRVSIHEPVLTNTVGHCAGAIIFAILLYLFLLNWHRGRQERSILPALAAALAMFWNIGSLIALASQPTNSIATDVLIAASFSVLSLLPAVLLHISLESQHRELWASGYILSTLAVALHVSDLLTQAPRFHYAALVLVTLGFGALTVISVLLEIRQRNKAAGSRLAGAMFLFLLAVSFLHFGSQHPRQAWEGEIALHHAGLPLALLVLLQDYRFLLLDTFLRFLVNASFAAAAVLAGIRVAQTGVLARSLQRPFEAGLLFVAACLLLAGFMYLRNRMQHFLTRIVFLRSNTDETIRELQHLARAAKCEAEYLDNAAELVARFVHTNRFKLITEAPQCVAQVFGPVATVDPGKWKLWSWVEAVVPLRFSRGDAVYLLLGSRTGGRRYLSEDFHLLSRLSTSVVEHLEHFRSSQMRGLVSQAELQALQSQINPHFLFNSLNTLYGVISRDNPEARRLVINLADIFRYFLGSDRTFIAVEEEVKIVRAYLEIESLRLGPRLRTEMEIDSAAATAIIPALSIQPLVENAVKHGVATRIGDGFIRLSVNSAPGEVTINVLNSGECDERNILEPLAGIGLSNVRRRLALCYGEASSIQVHVSDGTTSVGFSVPLKNEGMHLMKYDLLPVMH